MSYDAEIHGRGGGDGCPTAVRQNPLVVDELRDRVAHGYAAQGGQNSESKASAVTHGVPPLEQGVFIQFFDLPNRSMRGPGDTEIVH